MPTAVPLAAFSATRVGGRVAVGRGRRVATSVTVMVKVWLLVEGAAGVAGLDGDVVAGGRLVVEQRAVRRR